MSDVVYMHRISHCDIVNSLLPQQACSHSSDVLSRELGLGLTGRRQNVSMTCINRNFTVFCWVACSQRGV